MTKGGAVLVCVRVRPFNKREINLGTSLCIDISNETTYIHKNGVDNDDDENAEVKEYTFDYSLWSHYPSENQESGKNPDRPDRENVDQTILYNKVGKPLLEEFWNGFDCCMFAYGQSGAGKSFSMTGTGPISSEKNEGIIPRFCKAIFKKAKEIEATDTNIKFKITCSMLEIYVDKVYDLLIPKDKYNVKTRKPLQIQMSQVKNLSKVPVKNYDTDVSALLVRGFSNQLKAPTGLNVDSSRGHTIFTLDVIEIITGTKKGKKYKQEIHKTMQLVDLAGSERSEKMLSITKDNLQELLDKKHNEMGGKKIKVTDKYFRKYLEERKNEGTAINKSLTVLGKCVEEVAKISTITNKKERNKKMNQISWRSSALTRLLRPALSGECKTVMIAAISPSTTEYDETISTMRYCDNIKKIPSIAKAKERTFSAEEMLQKKLAEVEAKLQQALANGTNTTIVKEVNNANNEEMMLLQQQIAEMKKEQAEHEQREKAMEEQMAKLRAEEIARKKDKENCHLLIMTSNPMTSGLFPIPLTLNNTPIIAGQADQANVTIALKGTKVEPIHCTFEINKAEEVYLIPSSTKAIIFINGQAITTKTQLKHNDRLRLASDNYYRFIDPKISLSAEQIELDDELYTYEYIKEEAMSELLKSFEQDDVDAIEATKRANLLQQQLNEYQQQFQQEKNKLLKQLSSFKQQHELEIKNLTLKMNQYKTSNNEKLLKQTMLELNKKKQIFKLYIKNMN